MDTPAFRSGLKSRGLTELLELHLQDFPPESEIARIRMKREVQLAKYADTSLPNNERLAALAEANVLLEELIQRAGSDRRRFKWTIQLATSLIYEEGSPHFSSILYRGGNQDNRDQLARVTARAIRVLDALREELASEYERVDALPIRDFERLERSGYVELLDQSSPQADYLLLWSLFYDSLTRKADDLDRVNELNRIIELIRDMPGLLEVPHSESKVQVQGLLLTGMTYRRLNRPEAAREHFAKALLEASRIQNSDDLADIKWAVTVARIEQIRNETFDKEFRRAREAVRLFREDIDRNHRRDFSLKLVAALAERSVYKAMARDQLEGGDEVEAAEFAARSWQPLARLIEDDPSRRDEVYAALYDQIDRKSDPAKLGAFEKSALMAGLLYDATLLDEREQSSERERLFDKVISVGNLFLQSKTDLDEPLVPGVLYNLGVALFQQNRTVEAASRFAEIARDHPKFDKALRAGTLGVQIFSELQSDPRFANHPDLQAKYLEALEALVVNFANSDAGVYWRFFWAQLLEETGEFDRAASQYALVKLDHPHHIESTFLRLRASASSLRQLVEESPEEGLEIRRRFVEFHNAHIEVVTTLNNKLSEATSADRTALIKSLLAQTAVTLAEVQILPPIDRAKKALDSLETFETDFPGQKGLIGRVLRARLLAHEQLGRLEEAMQAIPSYVSSDPENAGPTLQALYQSMVRDIRRLEELDNSTEAKRKASAALMLAQQVSDWANRNPEVSVDRHLLSVQLAEANLRAERFDTARKIFSTILGLKDKELDVDSMTDFRSALGYAESLFQLERFNEALPIFNRLTQIIPVDESHHWKSLLRDLQCRAKLGHKAADIVRVIDQQSYLHPEMGNPKLASEFKKLRREQVNRDADHP